jgi:molybdate-binding protein
VPDGPRSAGHLEVVRSVADGAPAGVTMEPAALNSGLAFEPLEQRVCEFWVDARWRKHPAVEAFASLLSIAFTQRLALVGGDQTAGCGSQHNDLS